MRFVVINEDGQVHFVPDADHPTGVKNVFDTKEEAVEALQDLNVCLGMSGEIFSLETTSQTLGPVETLNQRIA